AFGATDITHWGYHGIRLSQFEYGDFARAVWDAMERLNRELYVRHGRLATTWQPAPRRAAFWLSNCDLAHAGTERYDFAYAMERAEDLFRALVDTGEPFDIVYDDEVLAGRLSRYRLLVTPPLKTATVSLANALRQFIARGGVVVAPDGFDLPGVAGVQLIDVPQEAGGAHRQRDYPAWRETLSRTEHRKWLHTVADRAMAAGGLAPRVRLNRRDVVANLMQAEGRSYLVLVNDNRTFGPWAAKYGKTSLDKGLAARVQVTMDGVTRVMDVDTGNALHVRSGSFAVTLEPGWGRILQYE
ncbi:MAG: hypothetical protein ACE5JM_02805, partial [Armatimonadota bacterium]